MSKIFVEETEIHIWEKTNVDNSGHQIEGNYYIMHSVTTTDFKSAIFQYEDMSVLISKITRFNEEYYKVVLFNDKDSKAWPLIILSAKLDIKIKRLGIDVFIVTGESSQRDLLSQVSFCKLKPSLRVDEITINFSKLSNVHYIGGNSIVLNYDEKDEFRDTVVHVLSMYNYEGKLLKNFYEYCDLDEVKYHYAIEDDKIKVMKKEVK